MPRKAQLTWQAGTKGRKGRWRKKYKGHIYHFPGGRGKTDLEAHDLAVRAWEDQKARIDEETLKQHEADYVLAIAEWDQVLTWCRKHQEEEMADVAVEKLGRLRKALSAPKPRPVERNDTFPGRFDHIDFSPDLKEALAEGEKRSEEYFKSDTGPFAGVPGYSDYRAASDRFLSEILGSPAERAGRKVKTVVVPARLGFDSPDPLVLRKEVWRDRLEVMQRAAKQDNTLKVHVDLFLAGKRADADAGELTVGRVEKLRIQLSHFCDWLGSETPVAEITSQMLRDYRSKLLEQVTADNWSRTTASDRLGSVKSLVRWLWDTEAISSLPRSMTKLEIGKSNKKIVDFDHDEIRRLLTKASNRTRLYILLMLNCGQTQKDVADLSPGEVDWDVGRITRKRSKTRGHAGVPEVSYLLWPETLSLLRQERSSEKSDRVLLNEKNEPLWMEELSDKYKKNDNVRSAFDRLRRKLKIGKSLISLKKTSASLIRSSKEYKGLEDVYLAHAPQKMSDRHYAKAPQELLDEAIKWLREQYGISQYLTQDGLPRTQQEQPEPQAADKKPRPKKPR